MLIFQEPVASNQLDTPWVLEHVAIAAHIYRELYPELAPTDETNAYLVIPNGGEYDVVENPLLPILQMKPVLTGMGVDFYFVATTNGFVLPVGKLALFQSKKPLLDLFIRRGRPLPHFLIESTADI